MLPLVFTGITSTNAMIKRLGGKRWRALHRPAYGAAIAEVIHYYTRVKAEVRQPPAFAAALTVLPSYRLFEYRRQRKPPPVGCANGSCLRRKPRIRTSNQ